MIKTGNETNANTLLTIMAREWRRGKHVESMDNIDE